MTEWLLAKGFANDEKHAERQLGYLLSLNFAGNDDSTSTNSDKGSQEQTEEWLQWVPDKPKKRSAPLNAIYPWKGQSRSASEVKLGPNLCIREGCLPASPSLAGIIHQLDSFLFPRCVLFGRILFALCAICLNYACIAEFEP